METIYSAICQLSDMLVSVGNRVATSIMLCVDACDHLETQILILSHITWAKIFPVIEHVVVVA